MKLHFLHVHERVEGYVNGVGVNLYVWLGQANKINCFSGIFFRKTHAGCGFFFFFCKPQPQLVSDQKPQASHSRE